MPSDDKDITAAKVRLKLDDQASRAGTPNLNAGRLLIRMAGCLQWLCALDFGWHAVQLLRFSYQSALHFKDVDEPAHWVPHAVFFGTICVVLTVMSLIGGYGLIGLRRWAYRWEIAYLGVLSAGVAVLTIIMAFDTRMGSDGFTALVLYSLAYALPGLPSLLGMGRDATGATGRRAAGKTPLVTVPHGVGDRFLDG